MVIGLVAAVLAAILFAFGAGPVFWGSIVIGMIVVVFTEQLNKQ